MKINQLVYSKKYSRPGIVQAEFPNDEYMIFMGYSAPSYERGGITCFETDGFEMSDSEKVFLNSHKVAG